MNQDKAIYLENKYFSPANEAVRLEREGDYIGAWKNGMMRFIMPKAKI